MHMLNLFCEIGTHKLRLESTSTNIGSSRSPLLLGRRKAFTSPGVVLLSGLGNRKKSGKPCPESDLAWFNMLTMLQIMKRLGGSNKSGKSCPESDPAWPGHHEKGIA